MISFRSYLNRGRETCIIVEGLFDVPCKEHLKLLEVLDQQASKKIVYVLPGDNETCRLKLFRTSFPKYARFSAIGRHDTELSFDTVQVFREASYLSRGMILDALNDFPRLAKYTLGDTKPLNLFNTLRQIHLCQQKT